MKKVYILFAALFIGGTAFLGAQTKTSRWYNYAEAKGLANGALSAIGADYLFPDSVPMVKYSNGDARPFFHNVANVLDVTAPAFNDPAYYKGEMELTGGGATQVTYTVDSMSILLKYNRVNKGVVDTLYVEAVVEDFPLVPASSTVQFPASQAFGTDITYKRLYYNDLSATPASQVNTLKHTGKKVYTILLNDAVFADSTVVAGYTSHLIKFATPGMLPATAGIQQVAAAIRFAPGYTYTATDTLNYMNNVQFIATEENGTNTFMTYTTNDFNISYFADTYIRYGITNSYYFFPGRYNPSFAFPYVRTSVDAAWSLENLVWGYHVLCSSCHGVSVNELSADFTNGIKLSQNTPNPANGLSVINYELAGNSNVSFFVYDITGKRVLVMEEGKQAAGKHSLTIDTRQLQSGVYFYNLTSDSGASLTRKMIITE